MSRVITYDDVMRFPETSSTERSPVNVEMFFSFLNNSLETLFDATDSNATDFNKKKHKLLTYLESLYSTVIIKEKDFKRSLPTYNAAMHDGVTKFVIKGTIWVGVIKACKSSAAKENNWAIYGHYGLNFVANYIWSQRVGKKEEETDELYKERLAWLDKLPKVHDLLMVAMRLDRSTVKVYQEEKNPNVEAIVRACQLSHDDIDEMVGVIKVEDWPGCFASALIPNRFTDK